jgi:transcriptional regulator with XRE-family HTH domain
MGDDLGELRRARGVSLRAISRELGVSVDRLARAERGDASAMTIDLVARYAAQLGLQLAASLHPDGEAIRDRGHLALLERFRRRLPASVRWRTEVPIPLTGDPRSADGWIESPTASYLVEAETHLGDFQAVERRMSAKARDLSADRIVLLLADTRHHRTLLASVPGIRQRFPVDMRTWFEAIARGHDPGADGLVIL